MFSLKTAVFWLKFGSNSRCNPGIATELILPQSKRKKVVSSDYSYDLQGARCCMFLAPVGPWPVSVNKGGG